jgi:hypothetical protein
LLIFIFDSCICYLKIVILVLFARSPHKAGAGKKNQKIKAGLKWQQIFFIALKENKLIATSLLFGQIFFFNAPFRKFFIYNFNQAILIKKGDLKEIY